MFYTIIRGLLRFIFYFLGLKAEGLENLPQSGPVIIAANHVSNWDPVVVALVLNRPVYFMGKAELFKYKIIDKLFTSPPCLSGKRRFRIAKPYVRPCKFWRKARCWVFFLRELEI